MKKLYLLSIMLITFVVNGWSQESTEIKEAIGIFDFNQFEHPVSTNTSSDGDITISESFTSDDVTITISPKSKGNYENRFWGTATGPQLRMYSGTINISAVDGTMLKSIYFVAGRWNDNNSVDKGSLSNGTWTGNAKDITISIAGNTQITKIFVGVEPETPEISTIADFKALPSGSNAILTLTDARVTGVVKDTAFVEDNSGAIMFYKTGLTLMAGKLINGTVIAKSRNYYGTPQLYDVAKSNLLQTEGEVLPTTMTFSDMLKSENCMKFANIENANIKDCLYLSEDETNVSIIDLFETDVIKQFRKVKSITGIIGYDSHTVFYPTAIELYGVENIAALKMMEAGSGVNLTLQNAMCTYGIESAYMIFEDETGAVLADKFVSGHVGHVYNGTIEGVYEIENGVAPVLNFSEPELTQTDGRVTPTMMAVADMAKEENIWRYVSTGHVYINNGKIYEDNYSIPYFNSPALDKAISAESISGIIILRDGKYTLEPTSVKNAVATGIVTISETPRFASVFSVSGRAANKVLHGLNIIRMNDGTTRKVLVK